MFMFKQHSEFVYQGILLSFTGHPEIFPLVLTTQTQAIFNCRVDEDVTEENCFKIIKKEDVIQDLKRRAKISDFYPIKNVILEYPGEELLVVLDKNFQYGQNFYLVASEEAKENLLKPPETAEEKQEEIEEEVENTVETLEIQPYRPPVQKPWVSLGSEKEVEEESVKDTVTKIKYMISRVRRKFGAPITFTDSNASDVKDSYIECTSYQDKTFSIKMLEKDVGVQMVPKVRESSTQTEWTYPKNAATQYFPRELSDEEKEDYLSSEKLTEFLTSVHLRMEIALQQNEIMNPFFDDWKALAEDESSSGGKPDVYLQAYQSFTDLRYPKDRTISCVCWHPNIDGVIAVSARQRLSYEEHINLSDKALLQQSAILFWSVSDPIQPQLLLECPEDIYCFQFSPSNPSIIAGGCINGQVLILCLQIKLDIPVFSYSIKIRVKTMEDQQSSTEPPLVKHWAASPIDHAHKKPVTDIIWLLNYFEVSLKIYFSCCPTTTFFVPSDQKHTQKYTVHTETINTLQRSPFFKDIVLSIGGRKFAIWKEEVTYGAILQSSCSSGRYTAGRWSLTRPGVFFIGRDDGNVDIWDLLKKTHEPLYFQNISESKITFISPWIAPSKQHFLAVSDDLGVLHVLEICQALSDPLMNEVGENFYSSL
uniref:WD repeat domain 63 n=1 Tax=Amazona collaria TaxID=241587 RepID=A0A8B9FDZ1_9PSIT